MDLAGYYVIALLLGLATSSRVAGLENKTADGTVASTACAGGQCLSGERVRHVPADQAAHATEMFELLQVKQRVRRVVVNSSSSEEDNWLDRGDDDMTVSYKEDHVRPHRAGKLFRNGTNTTKEHWDCNECDVVVDLRCAGIRAGRHAFYHRIVDCLLPFYGLVDLVRWKTGRRCAVTWFTYHRHADPNLVPFLELLAPDARLKLIDEDAPCSKDLSLITVQPSFKHGFEARFVDEFAKNAHVAKSYSIDLPKNARLLQRDSLKYSFFSGNGGLPHTLFILRRNGKDPTGQPLKTPRVFNKFTEERLEKSLSALSLPIVRYFGAESVAETIKMFSTAQLLVGYHGAGVANAMFTSCPACVLEVSTFKDLASKKLWRTNDHLVSLNSNLAHWYTYNVPLKQMLDANSMGTKFLAGSSRDIDSTIKDLPLVQLTSTDMAKIDFEIVQCLAKVKAMTSAAQNQVRHQHNHMKPVPEAPPPRATYPKDKASERKERDGVFKVNPKDKESFDFS